MMVLEGALMRIKTQGDMLIFAALQEFGKRNDPPVPNCAESPKDRCTVCANLHQIFQLSEVVTVTPNS